MLPSFARSRFSARRLGPSLRSNCHRSSARAITEVTKDGRFREPNARHLHRMGSREEPSRLSEALDAVVGDVVAELAGIVAPIPLALKGITYRPLGAATPRYWRGHRHGAGASRQGACHSQGRNRRCSRLAHARDRPCPLRALPPTL